MSRSESSLLFHGPSAQAVAATEAAAWGRIIGSFGDPRTGIDVETARAAMSALSSVPVGDRRGSAVIGPVDVTTQEGVVDVLLKVMEEPDPQSARAFVWAWDEGSVRPTIRSRCLSRWCPGQRLVDPAISRTAREMVRASLANEPAGLIESLSDLADDDSWKSRAQELISSAIDHLSASTEPDGAKLKLWGSLRALASAGGVPSRNEILDGFLP